MIVYIVTHTLIVHCRKVTIVYFSCTCRNALVSR